MQSVESKKSNNEKQKEAEVKTNSPKTSIDQKTIEKSTLRQKSFQTGGDDPPDHLKDQSSKEHDIIDDEVSEGKPSSKIHTEMQFRQNTTGFGVKDKSVHDPKKEAPPAANETQQKQVQSMSKSNTMLA